MNGQFSRKAGLLAAGCVLVMVATAGCNSQKAQAPIPPAPTAANLPPVPSNVPPAQQEQAQQQMLAVMQSGRAAAMHANGQNH